MNSFEMIKKINLDSKSDWEMWKHRVESFLDLSWPGWNNENAAHAENAPSESAQKYIMGSIKSSISNDMSAD